MTKDLNSPKVLAGVKQSSEAVASGLAEKAYIAEDCDSFIANPFIKLCMDNNVEIVYVESKKQLGKACGINVSAACAVKLK